MDQAPLGGAVYRELLDLMSLHPLGSWVREAACSRVGSEPFTTHGHDVEAHRLAERVCRRCPVRQACADYVVTLVASAEPPAVQRRLVSAPVGTVLGMTTAPSLTPPRPGDPLGRGLAYARRDSARRQAAGWNEVLAADPVFGPGSGCVVAVGERTGEGLWPLVWAARGTPAAP